MLILDMPKRSCSQFAAQELGVHLSLDQQCIADHWHRGGDFRVIGRLESGKTLLTAVIALHACSELSEHFEVKAGSGRRWHVLMVFSGLEQARSTMEVVRRLVDASSMADQVTRNSATEMVFANNCAITAIQKFPRALRGLTVGLAILDDADSPAGFDTSFMEALAPSLSRFGQYGKILELVSSYA